MVEALLTVVSEWGIRGLVILSLLAHVLLAIFASFRRRQRSGVVTVVLWSSYQYVDWAAPYILGKLPFGSTSSSRCVPFLLSHLGGPDNITAFSFEDNKLSLRKAVSTLFHLLGTISAVYKQVNVGASNGSLLWASPVLVAIGGAKYVEKAMALRVADFGEMRKAAKKLPRTSIRIQRHGEGELTDEQALLVAHGLLHITKGAFADYSIQRSQFRSDPYLKELFARQCGVGWKNMCEVVEMELSLMYDILYTKAAKIHTCLVGYFIRIVSPVATATMAMLFLFSSKDGQRMPDVIITYILLVVTFLLEVRWLLRVAASTWAYAFFNSAQGERSVQHEVFCTRRWHRLRCAIVSLDPRQLLLGQPRGNYRLWTGTIGQYNLFDECTRGKKTDMCSSLLKMFVRSDDAWTEYKYSSGFELGKLAGISENICKLGVPTSVRGLLFEQIKKALGKAYPRKRLFPWDYVVPTPLAVKREEDLEGGDDSANNLQSGHLLDVALGFVPEFQELVLILHVATDVSLAVMSNHYQQGVCKNIELYKEAIEVTSNYMTFLAAARPEMLPGLNLRSLFNVTSTKLGEMWEQDSGEDEEAE
nr:unnamed protein product [Digitaria exilis]